MFNKLIIRGIKLGITAGLLVTLFDGFFILDREIYVPATYPFYLFIFNIIFWMSVGMISGFFLWAYLQKRTGLIEKEDFYWVVFFLIPFALVYGLMGRQYIPLSDYCHANSVYDHHLSFLWVAFILVFLLYRLRKLLKNRSYIDLLSS